MIPGIRPSKILFMAERLPEDLVSRPGEMNQLRSLLLKREAGIQTGSDIEFADEVTM
jgi:hypothetical protein